MNAIIIILVILNLLHIDFIKDNVISNNMEQYMNPVENSQSNKVVKSLPIFIKCNLDDSSSINIQKIIALKNFLKDKDLENFVWESVLPPLE